MTIGGNLTITTTATTTAGQSDTEVYDYNVHAPHHRHRPRASSTKESKASSASKTTASTTPRRAVPTFGSVNITGAPCWLNPGLAVFVGTDPVGADFPLQVTGNFSINASGGAANTNNPAPFVTSS